MSKRSVKALLLGCSGAAALLAATADANAGGFAIREQSAYGQGASFAGIAAGGSLSAMFWNPAIMTQMPGLQTESAYSVILPQSSHNASSASTLAILGGAPNSGVQALVPGSYASYQVNPNLWLGLSVNAPFGLSVSFPDTWAGRNYTGDTTLQTYNAVPTLAYRINDWISVGAGVQIQYAKVDLVTGLPVNGFGQTGLSALGNQVDIYGNGWGYGFTAGITLTPTPATTIGLGYRSQIDQKIDGTMGLPAGPAFTPGFGSTPGSVSTTVNLPDIVSLGIRQRLDPQWTLLGTVEWSNWSRIGTATVEQPNGAPATIGTVPVTLPFQYDDGWYFALGAEYVWTERTTLRAGIAYEISPITDQVRTPRLPDNDRVWLSAGMSYKIWKGLTGNIAYTHIFVRDTAIDISSTSGNPWFNSHVPIAYVGSTKPHVDIIALGLSWQWGEMAAPAKAPMYKK